MFVVQSDISGQIITTLAGNGLYGDSGDGGPATAAQFEYVWFTAIDSSGNLYITDNFDHKVRKVATSGVISTFAGIGSAGFSGDGGLAVSAQFIGAAGIAVDHSGNVYFSDINNRRVRKVNTSGFISTIAGIGSSGFSGDGGPASIAQLSTPYGVAVDDSGNVYVADELNFRIRKINTSGVISTVAGSGLGGYSGDGGPATLAQFTPTGIAVDGPGNIYIATNNRIRKVNTSGIISTVAGNGIAGFSGDGGPATTAKLNQPVGIAADELGNVYISDQYNYRIRRVNPSGIISSVAGNGSSGYAGDGGPATSAELMQPLGVCIDPYANIYFCDYGNHRIRKVISGNHIPSFIHWPSDSLSVCENSVAGSINSLLKVTDADSGQTETWTLIAPALHGTATVAYSTISTGSTLTPSGMYYTPLAGYTGNDTFKVRVDDGRSLDTISVYVKVKPLPDTGTITGNAYICMGTPDTLANTATGGIWSATNINAIVSGSGIVNGIMPGTDTILNTFTLNGCSLAASFPVTVYPVTDTITGPVAVCTGLTIDLHGSPAGGAWNVTNTLASVSSGIVTGDTAGTDTVIYTISNVCGIFNTIYPVTIIGFTIPSVIITATPPTIIAGEYDTLVAHLTGGGGITYGYQWQKNNVNITGATDSVYISNTFSNGDSVTCFIHNGPCNFETFTWTYIRFHNDGIKDIGMSSVLHLTPNPNKGEFFLEGFVPSDNNEVSIEINDVFGRVVYKDVLTIEHNRIYKHINTGDNLANGVYFLHVTDSDVNKIIRFAISR